MSYNGIEVDMLSLGNADSILVTSWTNGAAMRILVDGGKVGDSEKVLTFLAGRGASYVNHIVCSHPHDDHAGGLPAIIASQKIDFGQAWMHLPWKHVDVPALQTAIRQGETTAKRVVKIIRASVQSAQDILNAVQKRKKVLTEPFQGQNIGFMTVCGPSEAYYAELLKEFTDFEKLTALEEAMASDEREELFESVMANTAIGKRILEETEAAGELGAAPTDPENNSSTILGAVFGDHKLL